MTLMHACEFPPRPGRTEADPVFQLVCDTSRADAVREVRPLALEVELTTRCHASCKFCHASSTSARTEEMPLANAKRLISEARDVGIHTVTWMGGDPHLYSGMRELMQFTADQGLFMQMPTSGLFSRRHIQLLCDFQDSLLLGIHIDTIDPDLYGRVHFNPRTREGRMKGYRRLLDAGFPPHNVFGIITMTNPVLERVEETIDWFYDEMGAVFVCLMIFKGEGFGRDRAYLEPSMSGIRRANEYRAAKMGDHWLRLGSSEGSIYYCRTNLCVDVNGHAYPCLAIRDFGRTESVFEHGLRAVLDRHRDTLLFNFQPAGMCGDCPNNDLCFGCRASAYYYAGDITAADPKCWLNPEAPEYCAGSPR